jgi:hypothetical protein
LQVLKKEAGISEEEFNSSAYDILREDPEMYNRKKRVDNRRSKMGKAKSTYKSSIIEVLGDGEELSAKELRLLFISMLRSQYEQQIEDGLLVSSNGLEIALDLSLEEAETEVNNGGKLNDLKYLQKYDAVASKFIKFGRKASCGIIGKKYGGSEEIKTVSLVTQSMSFVLAHERAQAKFQDELGESDSDLSDAGKAVISESKKEMKQAEKLLNNMMKDAILKQVVVDIRTHRFCEVLLNRGIQYVEEIHNHGLLKESEAEELVEELAHLISAMKKDEVIRKSTRDSVAAANLDLGELHKQFEADDLPPIGEEEQANGEDKA